VAFAVTELCATRHKNGKIVDILSSKPFSMALNKTNLAVKTTTADVHQ